MCNVKRIALTACLAIAAGATVLAPADVASAQTRPAAPATNGVANEQIIVGGLDQQGRIRLAPGKSVVLTTRRPQSTINVGNPELLSVNGISPTRVLLTAKQTGSTQLIVWDDQDRSQSVEVVVAADVMHLAEQFDRLFPGHKISATSSGETVVLSGTAANLSQAEQAALLAAPFGKNVVNLVEVTGNQQVMLQVRVAEVSKTATRQLGVNFGFTDGTAQFGSNVGGIAPLGFKEVGSSGGVVLSVPQQLSENVQLFGTGSVGQTTFAYFLNALRENNLLRVLAEPNLVAISGQEASFLAGGEFPIPVPQGGLNDSITIEFKEFGVRLKFIPVVLGDGRIRLKLSPEVSDLDFSTAVRFGGFVVPGITQRRVTTTVEMMDGQSLAIAGLLNQTVSANKAVTPVLGDVPVIGALFRSVRYQRRETELVIFVTPRLVSAVSPDKAATLPGEKWRHPHEAELFLNQDIGGPAADAPASQSAGDPRRAPRPYYGSAGFVPVAAETAAPAGGAQ